GLRYDYGIFRQQLENGYQVEQPDDWLRSGNPWEIARPNIRVPVQFCGWVDKGHHRGELKADWVDTQTVIGIPYDMPIVGYGGNTVNTLRLWHSVAAEDFDFEDFNKGDYIEAVATKVYAENLTKVLYPNDNFYSGRELRMRQQYFFVACSLADIVRRFKKDGKPWSEFPSMAAIQLNDTHPSLAVPELMRILLDQENLGWDEAWDVCNKTFGYTNHTLMPEALEKWPVEMMERVLPRHIQIIYEINHRFLQKVTLHFPGDSERIGRMSLVEEGDEKQIRMAYLSILGSHSTNGVAALHSELIQQRLVPDWAAMYPERFNNKTNGVTQRRWLLKSNPALSSLITDAIGDSWIKNMDEIAKLRDLAGDGEFRNKFAAIKKQNKETFAAYAKQNFGWNLNPDSIFDTQIKRIHEYKRQLLNAIHIVILYNRLRKGGYDMAPRTFFIGGKAAPGYAMAKLIIKLIGNISSVINNDSAVNGKLQVYFLPNYRVSLAERIIPATEVSEQISTAGTEASGTGNMKFMMNGALTIGTLDGANIEIKEEAGDENVFIFGMTSDEVANIRPSYNARDHYNSNNEIREAIDLLFSGHFNISEPGIFEPIKQELMEWGDRYMVLGDLASYAEAQSRLNANYSDVDDWNRKAIMNVAGSGKFSTDRTMREYAADIWDIKPVHIEKKMSDTIDEASFDPTLSTHKGGD
ncbi:MAG: glycogen/starch/alpha-glucan phosphorylase, partial [Planctomycetes bacterium]|nr:glycogen/starch/alpha-glucan phosphorylase [Planctomycetota bacterium]